MASLTGQLVAETYKALLKTIDNDILTASEKQITDGFGGGSNVFIDSQGFLRANKYKVTNGLATQFLKADGSLDSNTYLTGITSSQIISALGYTPVPTTRTLTINGTTYDLSANRSWTIDGTSAVWGNISGTLSNQTDLQNALNAKYNNPTGTISQYIRGDGTIANFPSIAGGLPTGGTAGQILAKIDATDYNAHWIDNYATQTKNEVKLGQTLTKGTAVYVSSANGTNMIVSAASNASEATSSKTLGLLETGGATNDLVKCVTFGLLAGLDTSTATAGDPVWLGVNGALIFGLANKPYAPAHLVYIGVVTRVQSNNGEIFVNVQNGFELKEIHDVYIADPANNHGLFYDLADGLWKNKSIASALGYTPQAQLSGTGFVKASGTTITYDNSTYLTTTDAASTYQRLDKMVSNLLASATEYPNSNAVINALALKADALNPVFTGYMTISGAEPKLYFTDTDQNPDYFIGADAGFFRIYDQTAGATRFVINSSGVTTIAGDLIVGTIAKSGGTATQFLKADGSIDSSTYLTSASLSGYLALTGGTMTGQLNSTYSGNPYAFIHSTGGGITTPQGAFFVNSYPSTADRYYTQFGGNWSSAGTWGMGTRGNGDSTIYIGRQSANGVIDPTDGNVFLKIGPNLVLNSGNYSSYALPLTGGTLSGSITATSFVKTSGTSSQFLKADGSVDSNSYALTSALGNYLPLAGGTMTGVLYGNGAGQFYIYNYGRIGLPNAGRILYNNGTASNMFFGEIASDVYGFTGNLYSDTPTIAMNVSSKRVGIGTSSPIEMLHLISANTILRVESTTGGANANLRLVTTARTWTIGPNQYLGDSSFEIADSTAGGARLWINNFGNVMVGGTATSPSGKLTIQATADGNMFSIRGMIAGYGYPNIIEMGQTGADGYINVRDGAGNIQSVISGYSGTATYFLSNLLVGTSTNAGYKLDVNGTSIFRGNTLLSTGGNAYSFFDRPNNGFDAVTIYRTNAANKWILGTRGNSNDNFHLYSYGTGNQPLEIVYSSGESIFSGQITANGGINLASTVRMRWGGNNTPALGFPFGGSDTGNSLFIEAADGDSGGIAINNDGVTVYGAADTGFVFRAIDEDSYQSGVGLANATTFQVSQGTNGGGYIRGNFNIYNGSAYADAFYENSDFRLKTLIEHNPIIDGIENLQAKLYVKNGKTELGYFAQDAEKLMPYAVSKDSDGFLSLSYREVHTAKIARLEQRVAELEKQLNLN
jgi:hypothetical protein